MNAQYRIVAECKSESGNTLQPGSIAGGNDFLNFDDWPALYTASEIAEADRNRVEPVEDTGNGNLSDFSEGTSDDVFDSDSTASENSGDENFETVSEAAMRSDVEASVRFSPDPYDDIFDAKRKRWLVDYNAIKTAYRMLHKEGDIEESPSWLNFPSVKRPDFSDNSAIIFETDNSNGICAGMSMVWLMQLLNGTEVRDSQPDMDRSHQVDAVGAQSRAQTGEMIEPMAAHVGLKISQEHTFYGADPFSDLYNAMRQNPGAWYISYRIPDIEWGHDVACYNLGGSAHLNPNTGVFEFDDLSDLVVIIKEQYETNFHKQCPVDVAKVFAARLVRA